MSRGSLFHIAGTGEPIFDRLASEISALYILGVEQRPSDSKGDRHRIDVEVRRRDVTIRSRQAFVLSPTLKKRSAEDNLRDALSSPFPVSGLPVRVTTFAQQDSASQKVRLTVAAQVGTPGAKPAPFTVGYIVIDDANQVAGSFLTQATLSPSSGSPNEPLQFVGGVSLEPGIYSLRFGVVDAEGRRGSVVRDVNAWKMAGEPLAMGDLIVGNLPASGQGLRAEVEPYVVDDRLAAYLELYSNAEATWKGATVTFEIADNQDSPALASLPAQLATGRQPTWRVATGVMAAQALPPGRYVARAQITRDGKAVGVLVRPFVLERAAGARTVAPTAVTAAALSFASLLPKFDAAGVMQGESAHAAARHGGEAIADAQGLGRRGSRRTVWPRGARGVDRWRPDGRSVSQRRGSVRQGAARSGSDAAAACGRSASGFLPCRLLSRSGVRGGRARPGCRRRVADRARHRGAAGSGLHDGRRRAPSRRAAGVGHRRAQAGLRSGSGQR